MDGDDSDGPALCHVCDEPATWNVSWSWPSAEADGLPNQAGWFECSDLCDTHVLMRMADIIANPGPITRFEVGRELQDSFNDRMIERLNGRSLPA